MEAFGAGILIVMLIFFGISGLANAYEASQRWKREQEAEDEYFDNLLNRKPWDRDE